ncbi:MAG: protein kinase domain-containing protein [Kofleriaceae bacterium]
MTRCPRCHRRLPPTSECPVHGRPSTVVSVVEDSLPLVVPPKEYALGPLIAAGGSALVYSVTHESGTPAILKWGRWRDRDIHERFEREARILSRLGKPLTPTLVGRNDPDDWPYLLMEAVSGETLAAWMSRSGENGTLGEIVTILMRLAHVLQQIHDAGYIHRDLKPENVVVGTNDTRILDFGLAAAEGGLTQTGAVQGTVHYMAPEQVRTGAAIDRRADLYAFGVVAFEMIAGQPPFIGERRAIEYQHQVVRPPSLREMRPVPAEIEAVVLHCLAKQPEARPQTAAAIAIELGHASAYIETLKGVGQSTTKKVLGARDRVVLVWIEGGDPITISRAITDVHGIVVRSRPGSVLAAFASQFHDAPLAVAVATCRELAHDQCRIVIHVATTLVRRSAQGKPAFYGRDLEAPANWTPSTIFSGLVLTAAAANLSPATVVPASDVRGFFRDGQRARTDSTDARSEVRLVGRDRILHEIGAIATAGGVLVNVSGAEGAGKSRVLAALVDRLRQMQREVIAVRGRRRLPGDRPDDERLFDALGGGDLSHMLAEVAARRAIVVLDDAHHFSHPGREQLIRTDLATSRVIASRAPMFEVAAGMTSRLAIELPALQYSDAERLLRELLEPARLIPDVLLQRLAIRAGGNPGLLVALARDIKHRGGIRRQEGTDDWYVAADEIDTLLAAPGAAWLAARGLEGLAVELAPIVRTAAALGPKFDAAEVAAVLEIELSDAEVRSRRVVQDGVFAERNGWYEFVDAGLQDAIYEHALDERTFVHARALRYWLANRTRNLVGWLARVAYHASGSGDGATGAACSNVLARYARERGELDLAAELEQRALSQLMTTAPSAVADAVRALTEAHGLALGEDEGVS